MVMNKYSKVRAALCWDVELAKLAREHNDANVLSIPARFVSEEQVKAILAAFLDTPFEGGRHEARGSQDPPSSISHLIPFQYISPAYRSHYLCHISSVESSPSTV